MSSNDENKGVPLEDSAHRPASERIEQVRYVMECAGKKHVEKELSEILAEVQGMEETMLQMLSALRRIEGHFDMDGYGADAWKNLALEMADVARKSIAKAAHS